MRILCLKGWSIPAILVATTLPIGGAAAPDTASGGSAGQRALADVVSVSVRGEPDALQFEVGIESPDTGCDQYADWWEVVGLDGKLVYRRILRHSHVDEQPFVRSGGPVEIDPRTVVWVRAHMHPTGYGGRAMKGSVDGGFSAADPEPGFAAELAEAPPLPDDCAF